MLSRRTGLSSFRILLLSAVFFIALPATEAAASQATLSFDEFTTSTFIPSTQYASSGVLFSRIGGGDAFVYADNVDPSVLVDPNGSAFSVPSMLCGNNPANVGVNAQFVSPTSQAPSTTDFVTVNVSSGPGPDNLSSNVALTAYNGNNDVIATDPGNASAQFDTLTVSAPGIARVEMTAGGDLDCYDDFTFNTPASYSFGGFRPPIDSPPTVNKGSAGKTYPIKFQLTDEDGNQVTSVDAVSSIKYKSVACGSFTGDPSDAIETTATGGTSLRFDGNQFVYNWKTPSQAGCYELFVTLADGGVDEANFQLK